MKRIQDKIKDLVEPQSFEQVGDYAEDPAQALAAYRFTDVTSDLLSRWLHVLANLPEGHGAAYALAGPRGVGKSHTLSVFGALTGSERLRQAVGDANVGSSAEKLAGRRFSVVRVERGTRSSLVEELAVSFSDFFGGSETRWGGHPAEVLAVAASRAAGETLVVIVDTAFNRPARVSRDDGPVLAALATAADELNAFVALALDDDIAGADGANVALSGTYRIDYLDPENLYRVADQFVLRKRPKVSDTLREIYQDLRSNVQDFNWSQQRFASVYPLHPLVAEVSAGVRLYVPSFAFLPFAASAAARATSRPALSLVLLDEVFDATEEELRRHAELRHAFAAYDHLTERCIGQMPIMQRYRARLILKSLFILSLDGRGATPRDMCAALLLSDEAEGRDAAHQAGETLTHFARSAAPGSLDVAAEASGDLRYRFRLPAHGKQAAPAIQPAVQAMPEQAVVKPQTGEHAAAAHKATKPDEGKPSSNGKAAAGPARASDGREAAAARGEGAPVVEGGSVVEGASAKDESVAVGKEGARVKASVGDEGVAVKGEGAAVKDGAGVKSEGHAVAENVGAQSEPLSEEALEWARLLTGRGSLGISEGVGAEVAHEEVSAAIAAWVGGWRQAGLRQKFELLPDWCLTTRVWKTEAEVRKSFGRAAAALEAALAGKGTLASALRHAAEAFGQSRERFAQRTRALEDLKGFVDSQHERERVRAYLAAAEATGVDEIETARRELLNISEDSNNFLESKRRARFERLWKEFRARYGEHYAAAHDKTVGGRAAREELTELRRGERWREFEALARLPVVSSQVWRQAEELVRQAEGWRCTMPVRVILDTRPACVCRFKLARASELEELPQELEALMERGLEVYRRTLLMLGASLAISLDALSRRETDDALMARARALASGLAQARLPERLTRQDVALVERALRRMPAPPPVRVVAPNGDAGLLTREELRARFEQWLDELPEQPVLIEIVSKSEAHAT
ncbi:MAG TPA: DUF6079 family protein [Pyrinomonadaceae bacterium]|nr:DUF6079 family protein [Pyrinomonadaceae bacterium]